MPTPNDLRAAVADLSTIAAADMRRLWGDLTDPKQVERILTRTLPDIVTAYSLASSTVAADWYDEYREQQNIDGRFRAIAAELGDLGTDSLAGFATSPLYGDDIDLSRAKQLASGGLQLRIANAARTTIIESSFADPAAQGWQRSASGGCPFCQMLAGRGAVYSERTVDFSAHDNCNCVAVPAFSGRAVPVKPYTPSRRRISDADRARVRRWIASNIDG